MGRRRNLATHSLEATEASSVKNEPRAPNTLNDVIERRWSRRDFLKDGAMLLSGLALAPSVACVTTQVSNPRNARPRRTACDLFGPVDPSILDSVSLPNGFRAEVVLAWGDPILPGAPEFDWKHQSVEAQCGQFGYNCDFIAYIPLEATGDELERGLLCVNHEYSVGSMMFEGYKDRRDAFHRVTKEEADIERASVGHSVVEIRRTSDGWQPHKGALNRRISLYDTEIIFSGPVAGNPRLQTEFDPSGRKVIGTLANCSGGVTPWGTILFCEENINDYFSGDLPKSHEERERANFQRYGMHESPRYPHYRYEERFQLDKHPHEANRFGWVVEYDPMRPEVAPVKRTSLGRFLREASNCVLDQSGHVVVYSGDDDYFEYIYKWVSHRIFDPKTRSNNVDLLDSGDLFVARCEDDGSLEWVPLQHGFAGLTPEQGFVDQADVLLEARRAADIVGGTKMDRPEDVEPNPKTGRVYAMLTKNKYRSAENLDGSNPRANNQAGHVLEMIPPSKGEGVDHTSRQYTWDVFTLGGVQEGEHAPHENTLANPDNATFDRFGRLWISSDGTQDTIQTADGIWVCETEGPERAKMKRFVSVPIGAEATGPCFTPNEDTFFLAVQHPGHHRKSSVASSTSRWPHGDPERPPLPAVIAIRRKDGSPITL